MEELQQKLNSMAQELALFQINELQRNSELEKRIKELESTPLINQDLVNRIKTLEDARLRQIQLNSTFAVKTEPIKVKKTIWDLLK